MIGLPSSSLTKGGSNEVSEQAKEKLISERNKDETY